MKLSLETTTTPAKLLLIGESGSGKTGALASLVKSGRSLIVLDYDGDFAASWLVNHLRKQPNAAKLLSQITYASLRDKYKIIAGQVMADGMPKAFDKGMQLLTRWKTETEDLGPISALGSDHVLVIDSFAFMCKAAFALAKATNTNPDERSTYFRAQQMAESVVQLLCSEAFTTNVIMTSHVTYVELAAGIHRGFPTTIGKAFSPDLPKYFNAMLEVRSSGTGDKVRRTIGTVPRGLIELKSPIDLPSEMPLETGLSTYFDKLQGKIP